MKYYITYKDGSDSPTFDDLKLTFTGVDISAEPRGISDTDYRVYQPYKAKILNIKPIRRGMNKAHVDSIDALDKRVESVEQCHRRGETK